MKISISRNVGLVLALTMSCAFTVGIHTFYMVYWKRVVALFGGRQNTVLFGALGVYVAQYLVSNAVYAALYVLEIPFFEQYKSEFYC
jgi:hypothetical protein